MDVARLPLLAGPAPRWLPVATAAVVAAALAALAPALLNDPDTYWHVEVGRTILDSGLPDVDTRSLTAAGTPWIAKEWLSQVALWLAYDLGGWSAVVALSIVAVATAFALAAHFLLARAPLGAAVGLLGGAFVLAAPHLLARPHALALPLLVLWTVLLARGTEHGRPPPVVALLVVVLWANLHAGVSMATVLAAGFALDGVLAGGVDGREGRVLRWGGFVLGTVAASALTPYGFRSVLTTFEVLGLGPALSIITEWRPQDFSTVTAFEVLLLAGFGAALLGGVRLRVGRVLLLLGLLHLALSSVRNGTLLGLVGAVVVAPPLSAGRGRLDEVRLRDRLLPRVAVLLPAVAVAVACSAAAGLRSPTPAPAVSPVAAVEALDEAGLDRVLNAYGFGGYLLFSGRAPYVDGRSELYGGRFIAEHDAAVRLDPPQLLLELLDAYELEATLLPPTAPAVGLLDLLPGWERVHTDAVAVVHARTGG